MGKKVNRKKVTQDITDYFDAALAIFPKDSTYAHKYVDYARRLFCHNCYHYLFPGENCEVRIDSDTNMLLHICKDCKNVNRFGYKDKN